MCGVIGVIGPLDYPSRQNWASYEAYRGLLTLQHRGQDAAGILTFDHFSQQFFSEKNLGLVADVFNKDNLQKLKGALSIGHTRYATTGRDGTEDLQPLVTGMPLGIGMVHNGNLLNFHGLSEKMKKKHHIQFLTQNDLEIILQTLALNLLKDGPGNEFNLERCQEAVDEIMESANGAFALIGMIAGQGLFGLRDPAGIRPLMFGQKEILIEETGEKKLATAFASESLTLTFLGYENIRDVKPGEMVFATPDGEVISYQSPLSKDVEKSPCMFEWIYFSGAESRIENRDVYRSRLELGRVMGAKIAPLIQGNDLVVDLVCPVPDTSRTAAIALSESLNLPYREALIKNRYVHRSFILNTQEAREKAVELKLSPVKSEIEGKRILLVDDSIVRGTTSKKIISLLKKNGAKSVTLAVTCPPIRYGCFYGIDFPSEKELIAHDCDHQEVAERIGADRVIYLSEDEVRKALGLSELCMACLNAKYPTNTEEAAVFAANRRG